MIPASTHLPTDAPLASTNASRRSWLVWLGTAAALTLGLCVVALVGLAQLIERRPQPESLADAVELRAPGPTVPPEQASKPASERARPRNARAQPPRDEPCRTEALPMPKPVTWRIVLGPPLPAEENEAPPRRNRATEAELQLHLARAEEVGLGSAGASVFGQYLASVQQNANQPGNKGPADTSALLTLLPDLITLSLRDGPGCVLGRKAASHLDLLSRKLRIYLNAVALVGPNGRPMNVLRERLRGDLRGNKPEWLRAEAVPTINQMLMAEDAPTRGLLVELLAAIPEKPATVALAQRAVFDLDSNVRTAAALALKGRETEVWRQVLVKGLRYPWSAVADFAAEALVQLKDKGAIPDLVALLREPRPGRPYITASRRVLIREVVKINHLTNCLLCHPPALTGREAVLGVDPVQRISRAQLRGSINSALSGAVQNVSLLSGGHNYAGVSTSPSLQTIPMLIRGDITFLRQDFSVGFPAPRPVQLLPQLEQIARNNPALDRAIRTPLPSVRFDYVVRTRPVQPRERKKWQALKETSNPHRDAILFALRELTGKDHGDTTQAWDRAFPLAVAQVRSVDLANRLLDAAPLARGPLLEKYRQGTGIEHTWALARAIPRLSGPAQEVARLALINRLADGPIEDLRRHLGDNDPELCRAAVRACAWKQDHSLAADLTGLLDADAVTARLVRETLDTLSEQ
jgi:HEAT repeat protein